MLNIKVACKSGSVVTLRGVSLNKKDGIFSDSSKFQGAKTVDPDDDTNIGLLPLETGLAKVAWPITCDSDSN